MGIRAEERLGRGAEAGITDASLGDPSSSGTALEESYKVTVDPPGGVDPFMRPEKAKPRRGGVAASAHIAEEHRACRGLYLRSVLQLDEGWAFAFADENETSSANREEVRCFVELSW